MREAWQLSPYFFEIIAINFGSDNTLFVRCTGDNFAPRVNDHRIAVVRMTMNILADLVWRNYIHLVFDRPCAQQRFPVSRAGWKRKRRRDKQHFRASLRELPVQLREAQVVTYRESES